MYRARLGGDLDKAILGYVSSAAEDAAIAEYDILGSQAHVVMLHEAGIMGRAHARRVLAALEGLKGRIVAELEAAAAGGGSAGEDVHEVVEELVAREAGAAAGGRMHTARSRNDQVALDVRMKVRDDIIGISGSLLDVIGALLDLAEKHAGTAMPLYTHLQRAQPGTFSHYMLAHADALFRDLERLDGAFERTNKSPLGAGPVGGTGLPIDRSRTAGLLGFSGLVENSIDATSTRDFAAEFAAAAAILMTNLSRMAEDFVIWSSAEFSFLELSDGASSPSSVMPQKKNPDLLELTRGRAARTIGDLTAVLAACKGLATGYGRDLQDTKPPVWSAARAASGALAAMLSMLRGITVNGRAMGRAASGGGGGHIMALDVAERLVSGGVPFRAAHGIAGRLVREAQDAGMPLGRLDAARIGRAVAGTGADAGALAEAIRGLSAAGSLRGRTSRGSAGFAEQRRMAGERRASLAERRESAEIRRRGVDEALDGLADAVNGIAGPPGAATGRRKRRAAPRR